MKEAAYLASLFSGPDQEPHAPQPMNVNWVVPMSELPDAASTGFVGDYILEAPLSGLDDDPSVPARLWSVRDQQKEPIAFDSEEMAAWKLTRTWLRQHPEASSRADTLELQNIIKDAPGSTVSCVREQVGILEHANHEDAPIAAQARDCFGWWPMHYIILKESASAGSLISFGATRIRAYSIGSNPQPARDLSSAHSCTDAHRHGRIAGFSADGRAALCEDDDSIAIVHFPGGDSVPVERPTAERYLKVDISPDGGRVSATFNV